jgi:hypothetical protein
MLAEKVHGGLTRWELYENMPVYDTTNTDRMLNASGGLHFPILDRGLMDKYVSYLSGF